MFGRIAKKYDLANRLLTGGIDTHWRKRLVGAVQNHTPHDVLDLATGSGDVAFALHGRLSPTTRIVGADFCQPMLDEAEKKKSGVPRAENLSFTPADALALPFADESFDVVTISFGLRNLADRDRGLREMRRVLRPNGHLLVLEFSQPQRWFRPLYFFYLRQIHPRIAGAVTGDRAAYVYINDTIEEFPDRVALTHEIKRAGFASVKAEPMTFGIVALHDATK